MGSVAAAVFLAFAIGSAQNRAATQTPKLFRSDQEQQAFVRRHLRMEPSVVSPDAPVVIGYARRAL